MNTIDPTIQAKADAWLNGTIDEDSKAQIRTLIDQNPTELTDSFYQDLEFGTGGLRGLMGVGTNRMNVYTIGMATQGLANYLLKCFPGETIRVAITHDSRINNTLFAMTTANVLTANGIHVLYFKEMRPTPMLSFAVRHFDCKSGVMITASHNPKEYNGYKAYWDDGAQVVAPHDKNIIDEVKKITSFDMVNFDKNDSLFQYIEEDFDEIYMKLVKGLSLSPAAIQAQNDMPIVFSPIHGASGKMVPAALKAYGFDNVNIVKEQAEPDGNFPTVIYPNPEEAEALTLSLKLGKEVGAELVLACDPDGDRYAAAVPNGFGEFELLNGNQTGALLTYYLLSKWKETGKLDGKQFMVNTIVTTELIDKICEGFGVKCFSVLTGFKNIAAIIKDLEGKETFIGGGEESYGYLIGDFVRDKDGVSACAMVAELIAYYKTQGKTVFDVLAEIYNQFGFYKESLISVTKKGKDGAEQIQALMMDFREKPPKEMNGIKVAKIVDVKKSTVTDVHTGKSENFAMDKSNVMQFYLVDGSKISARPSGTEPKIKYYFSVNAPLTTVADYRSVEAELEERIEGLKRYFS
ncbi:phosphoglucomutase [Algoriphagus ratkowskyi]|uniref:Phospho-sugar mutase n=1 Tax=Algoriphagus ratkowskyi TaxID=57028 RepID=A0A2W7RAW9_9BACT|nr:phospho-sugar mutase [Algoriphagus ratkowskyi]PZX55380.1 phosphoglucomutase [Algoriphagus ratkowskyi]TXD79691.1 phospho-sugar mutase [Algoriphagus ratkowskyi]